MAGIAIYFGIALLIGLLFCFAGEKLVNAVIGLLAFTLSYNFIVAKFPDLPYQMMIAACVGVAALLLSLAVRKIAYLLLGILFGIALGVVINGFLNMNNDFIRYGIIVAAAIVCGVLADVVREPLVQLFTAAYGGMITSRIVLFAAFNLRFLKNLMADGNIPSVLNTLTEQSQLFMNRYGLYVLGGTAVMGLLGFLVQRRKG